MGIRFDCYGIVNLGDNENFNWIMKGELLTWYGNALNFAILIYLVLGTFNTTCFNVSQSLITAFGLMVSILIHFRNLIKN